MAKVSGGYESVVRGVSEQVPQDRRSGQHTAQQNMISDPVNGLARRHGSILKAEAVGGAAAAGHFTKLLTATAQSKPFSFSISGIEYDLIYRTDADSQSLGQQGFAFCFNKTTGAFVPISYAGTDTVLDTLVAGGVSAATSIGRFLFLAGHTIVPTWTGTARHNVTANLQKMAVWVRGGAYSRTFKITLTKANGTTTVASYKTVSASYPTLLDTTDLLTSDADYQKKVNDRVNAYNGEVTKWIGTAAADIAPESIAEKLRLALVAAGVTGCSVNNSTVLIDNSLYVEVKAEDGGDGSLIRGVGNGILAADLVSVIHYHGKVVKVKPQKSNSLDAFYLEAYAKDGISTGVTEVAWRESSGYKMQPNTAFCIATIEAGTLYIGGTPAKLQTLSGVTVPTFSPNPVGDDLTNPLPTLFGNRIDYLGSFQDRLVIGSGTIILFSKPGKYFDWFRSSVLTLPDDDPIEVFSLGAEDDIISSSVTYDRNLVLFGKNRQYTVSGRQPITPKTASIVGVTAHEGATDADPISSGNFVFYAQKQGEGAARKASLHQIQAGALADTPESSDLSQQLSTYIGGTPVQLVALDTPKFVGLRTTASRTTLYAYSYLDGPGNAERLFDSWSKWTWDEKVGHVIGITKSPDDTGLLIYMIKEGKDYANANKWWVSCEQFTLITSKSTYPYLDSLRPYSAIGGVGSYVNPYNYPTEAAIAFTSTGYRPFMGAPITGLTQFLTDYTTGTDGWVGIGYQALVTPTNPYIKDKAGNAILDGRLTLGRVRVSIADTGGAYIDVTSSQGTKTVTDFNGRILGDSSNLIGYQPIVTTSIYGNIGKETRQCSYSIKARTWLPLTITAVEWVGQYFNRTQRV